MKDCEKLRNIVRDFERLRSIRKTARHWKVMKRSLEDESDKEWRKSGHFERLWKKVDKWKMIKA